MAQPRQSEASAEYVTVKLNMPWSKFQDAIERKGLRDIFEYRTGLQVPDRAKFTFSNNSDPGGTWIEARWNIEVKS